MIDEDAEIQIVHNYKYLRVLCYAPSSLIHTKKIYIISFISIFQTPKYFVNIVSNY